MNHMWPGHSRIVFKKYSIQKGGGIIINYKRIRLINTNISKKIRSPIRLSIAMLQPHRLILGIEWILALLESVTVGLIRVQLGFHVVDRLLFLNGDNFFH